MATGRQVRVYWHEEFVLVAFLFLIFVGVIAFALRLPFDARLFPLVIGTAGVLLCALLAIASYRNWRLPQAAADAVPKDDPANQVGWPRYALALLAAPVFGLLLWLTGFFVAALAVMIAIPRLMGMRNWVTIGVVAIGTVAALALIFPYLLGVNLPHGIVGDWMIDRLRAH
jgi:hypothetical protein